MISLVLEHAKKRSGARCEAGVVAWMLLVLLAASPVGAAADRSAAQDLLEGRFQWKLDAPVLAPLQRPGDFLHSVKDPTIVRFDGRVNKYMGGDGGPRDRSAKYYFIKLTPKQEG